MSGIGIRHLSRTDTPPSAGQAFDEDSRFMIKKRPDMEAVDVPEVPPPKTETKKKGAFSRFLRFIRGKEGKKSSKRQKSTDSSSSGVSSNHGQQPGQYAPLNSDENEPPHTLHAQQSLIRVQSAESQRNVRKLTGRLF